MIKKIAMTIAMLVAMVGMVSAVPSVDICLDSPPTGSATCASAGTIIVYQAVDAGTSPGLHALYSGWDSSATYEIKVTDIDANPDAIDFGPSSGSISSLTGGKAYFTGWTPTKLTPGAYKVRAAGSQEGTPLEAEIIVKTSPEVVPELPTSALTMVGLIGLIGMVILRKKN